MSQSSLSLPELLQKCIAHISLKKARQLHALILTSATLSSYAQSPYLSNNILSMYGRCGSISDARKLFDRMPQRNLVSYNALVSACSRDLNHGVLCYELFSHMQIQGPRPNGSTFTSLLQACCTLEDRPMGSLLHAQGIKFGFLNDVCVQTSLLGMYSNSGDLESARKIFSYAVDKDAVLWNNLIFGNLKNDKIEEGLRLFGQMIRSGITPTQFTYSMVLNACGKLGYYTCGLAIHAQIILLNVPADLPLQNALLDMYCSCGDTIAALDIFNRIEIPDLVSWNSVLSGYAESGEGEQATNMFVKLLKISFPKPDEYTLAAIISATWAFPAIHYGKPLHAQVVKAGLDSSVFVGTTLLSMYFRNGDTGYAQNVFNLIVEKDVVLWTELIMGYCKLGNAGSAIKVFCKMCKESHKRDSFALSAALSACADLATLKQGEMIHNIAIKTGCDAEMCVCGSLIDMYAKNGNLQGARSIFSRIKNPDLKCWNSMLAGYGHHGMAEEAMKLFGEILAHGLRLDQVTFLSVLSACSHGGSVEKGKYFWSLMKANNITPGPKHYSCMVSLLSRAGLLREAERLIMESIDPKEHLELWRTLLSSCVEKRNLRIGVRAAEQVLRLDPEDSPTYVLLSNLYAAAGRWDCVAEMRRKIRELMLEKDPGISWIEARNGVHLFSSGDQSNLIVDEAQAEVLRLTGNMIKSVAEDFDAKHLLCT